MKSQKKIQQNKKIFNKRREGEQELQKQGSGNGATTCTFGKLSI